MQRARQPGHAPLATPGPACRTELEEESERDRSVAKATKGNDSATNKTESMDQSRWRLPSITPSYLRRSAMHGACMALLSLRTPLQGTVFGRWCPALGRRLDSPRGGEGRTTPRRAFFDACFVFAVRLTV